MIGQRSRSATLARDFAIDPGSRALPRLPSPNIDRKQSDAGMPANGAAQQTGKALLPIMTIVLISFLGFALPVLPLHVHQGLGLSAFVVGLVTGSQFAAAVVSRVWAGRYADMRGGRHAVVAGLLTAAGAGLLYLTSVALQSSPWASVSVLLAGRALLGGAESFIITGALSWGLALVGADHAGKVIAWVGMAMFAALALGAPIGTALYSARGFDAVALATIIVPVAALAPVALLAPARAQHGGARPALSKVAKAVWAPGAGAALSSIGFGAILSFGALLFADRGWGPIWLPFSTFAFALIVARACFGDLPDRLGGAKVALLSVLVEAVGQALIWLSPVRVLAVLGAALTGFGYALVYPGLGVEAVRRSPPESRGLVMGAYTVFLDIALGFGSPALGAVASFAGLSAVFLASTLAVLCAAAVAARLLVASPSAKEQP
jgi:MFS family permease